MVPHSEHARERTSRIRPPAAVAAAALDGVEDPPDLCTRLCETGIVLCHARSVLAVISSNRASPCSIREKLWRICCRCSSIFALLLGKLIVVPGDHLTQVADHQGHCGNVVTEVVNSRAHRVEAGSHLGKSSCGFSRQLAVETAPALRASGHSLIQAFCPPPFEEHAQGPGNVKRARDKPGWTAGLQVQPFIAHPNPANQSPRNVDAVFLENVMRQACKVL